MADNPLMDSVERGAHRPVSAIWFVLGGALIASALACAMENTGFDNFIGGTNGEAVEAYLQAQADFNQNVSMAPDLTADMRELAGRIEDLWDASDPHIGYLNNAADELEHAIAEYNSGNYTQGAVASRFTQASNQFRDSFAYYERGFKLHNAPGLIAELTNQANGLPDDAPEKQAALDAAAALQAAYDNNVNTGTGLGPFLEKYDRAVDALRAINDYQGANAPPFPSPYPSWDSTYWDFSSP